MKFTVKPQLEKFIHEQVEAGLFRSPDEVVEAGLERLMLEPAPDVLDEQDIIDIRASMDQADRGELIDAHEVHAEIRRKYLGK